MSVCVCVRASVVSEADVHFYAGREASNCYKIASRAGFLDHISAQLRMRAV
jgi:hypothetical protein